MFDPHHIYAFDMETDNTRGYGLQPQRSHITEIAVATHDTVHILNGPEHKILNDLLDLWVDLPAGLIGSWNGLFFDVPFLRIRAALTDHRIQGFLVTLEQHGLRPKYDYLPGVHAAETFSFRRDGEVPHTHLDIATAWKAFAESHGTHVVDGETKPVVPWSLKPVAKAAGIKMVEIDRTRLHDYTQQERDAYVGSDAVGTRGLILKTFGLTD